MPVPLAVSLPELVCVAVMEALAVMEPLALLLADAVMLALPVPEGVREAVMEPEPVFVVVAVRVGVGSGVLEADGGCTSLRPPTPAWASAGKELSSP